MNNSKICIILLFMTHISLMCIAQTTTDSDFFLKEGIKCYNNGLVDEAVIEFENALLLNKHNFEAKIWLAQIYLDKKDKINARKLLNEVSLIAPEHPKVIQLLELLGDSSEGKIIQHDPVVYEVIHEIASGSSLRQYGLVIPENKVSVKNPSIVLSALDRERDYDYSNGNKKIDVNDYLRNSKGPLAEVFDALKTTGLTAALDKYFEKLHKDPTIGSLDDEGLIEKGVNIFTTRFKQNPGNPENRFYYGALQYINGYYEEAEIVLTPLSQNPGIYEKQLQPIMNAIRKWRADENDRIRLAKKAEEDKLEWERIAKEKKEQANKKRDVWDELKRKRAEGSEKANPNSRRGGPISDEDAALAEALHSQGYDLYKKGKLDEAISKYTESLKKNANDTECTYHLGLAWTDKGLAGDNSSFDKAISYFERVISLDPNGKYVSEAKSMINDIEQAKK